ncbi:efflux RND transporter periplasmic adaptor subunit [Oleiharenicola lentus]|uniref:Efflux RND transporter periplasmic adaptor subunit n=1 Tax=Oleiharenicola lentus TaxID=2508720 RepID=A0A4Q1CA86_9BACT|nr:efflux RND transporter periplasmic adaptor subunit [Oleiharenicola lentus]RXK55762.1 efflux RND transporter periplasmic adaptor subunit [Oleiharenicola lentus]
MSAPANQFTAPASAAPKKKSRRTLWLIIAIVVVAVVAGAAAVANKRKDKSIVVTTDKAVVKSITQTVNATGKVQPETEVKIAPEVAGEIIEMPFREGAKISKGDLLVSIRADNYRFQVEQQEAGLVAAKASSLSTKVNLLKAEEDFKRDQDLYQKQLISDSALTASKTAFESAKANYDSALANIARTEGLLNQMRDQLAKAIIYSPIDGTVTARTSEVGERVAGTGQYGGAEIMRIANLANMEVRVNVNENDVINVKIGDKARIAVDAYPNRRFNGQVWEIASSARTLGQNTQEEVTNFIVRIRILDNDATLRPGMSANADIETKSVTDVVAVPIQSVTVRSKEGAKTIDDLAKERDKKAKETQGEGAQAAVNQKQQRDAERADREALQRVVFLRDGDKVKMVNVETGIADTTHMEIKSGLKKDDEIVTGPFSVVTRTLKDGDKVRLEAPKKPAEKK